MPQLPPSLLCCLGQHQQLIFFFFRLLLGLWLIGRRWEGGQLDINIANEDSQLWYWVLESVCNNKIGMPDNIM